MKKVDFKKMLEQKRMKKIFCSLILISLLLVTLVPSAVLAQPVEGCTIRHAQVEEFDVNCLPGEVCDIGGGCGNETSAWGMCCMLDSVYTVIDWIFFGLIAVVSLFTIMGAFDILTAAGDPEKLKKGRERIMWAMIGLAVALLSRAIPSLVRAVIGTT